MEIDRDTLILWFSLLRQNQNERVESDIMTRLANDNNRVHIFDKERGLFGSEK